MKDYQHGPLVSKLKEIDDKSIEIDLKLYHQAKVMQEKLRT